MICAIFFFAIGTHAPLLQYAHSPVDCTYSHNIVIDVHIPDGMYTILRPVPADFDIEKYRKSDGKLPN